MEDPAHSSFSPAGFSCLHVPWMCSGSQGAGCSGEGMLTSSATGIMIFLKALWLPWAHTHTWERKHPQESAAWLLELLAERRGKPMLQSTPG